MTRSPSAPPIPAASPDAGPDRLQVGMLTDIHGPVATNEPSFGISGVSNMVEGKIGSWYNEDGTLSASIPAELAARFGLHHPPAPLVSSEAKSTDQMIDELTDGEGDTLTFCCKNPDFNGLPNECVIVMADWTDWKEREFRADTRAECLQAALAARQAALRAETEAGR